MFKWFSSKKNKINDVPKDEWIKDGYVLVPNETTPNDLREFQKLIVLRKPEGEQRCVVDYSLSFDDVNRLHDNSLIKEVENANIFDKDLKRIIPTYLNTKEIDDDINNTDEGELLYVSDSLVKSADEFRSADIDFQEALIKMPNLEVPILRGEDSVGKIFSVKLNISNHEKEKSLFKSSTDNEVDDIDSVDILTENDLKIRNTWIDVDDFFVTQEEIDKRKAYSDEDKTLSPFYAPKIQPLFRNFIDIDFADIHDLRKNKEKVEFMYGDEDFKTGGNSLDNENGFLVKSDLEQDPEIVYGDLEDNANSLVVHDQPKVLSFFKNEVSNVNKSSYGQPAHDEKYVKFYKESRNIKYEKIILDKKRGIYNIRRTLVK